MDNPPEPEIADSLRDRAEEVLGKSSADIEQMSLQELQSLAHELQVYQIELEMQNEELRNTQLQLQDSRNNFSELYEFAPVGYLTLDSEAVIQTANLTASAMFGLERAALVGTRVTLHVAAKDRDKLRRSFQQLQDSEAKQKLELHILNQDQPVWTQVECHVHQSRTDLWLLTLTDISLRKRAEAELQELNFTLEQRIQEQTAQLHETSERVISILNTAVDAIITIDHGGIIISMNPATETMFGYAEDELVGQNVKVIMPSPFRDEQDAYPARYRQTRQLRLIGSSRELLGFRKGGSTFPVDVSVSEVSHLRMFTGIFRDISERKKLQNALLSIAAEERRRIAHELHDCVGQVLTGLSLYADSLVRGFQEEEEKPARLREEPEFRKLWEIATELSRGIVECNKDVHSLCNGIMPLQVDAQGLKSALEKLAAATNEHVPCRFQSGDKVEITDNTTATQLYRIAQEAVANALKHSQADDLLISLRQDDDTVVLNVIDNGIGHDNTMEGRGLGLGIMHYRAGLIGAELHVTPREKGGTQVTCTLIPMREPYGVLPENINS